MIGIIIDVLMLALVGVALYAALRVAGWALEVLPVSRTRLDLTERAWPVIAGVGIVAYALFVVGVLLQRAPMLASLGGALVSVVLVALSWSVLRDAVAGVVLRAGRACRVGDYVRIDDIEGRVERLGWRAMVVVTPSDNEALVPYSRVVGSAIHRTPKRAEAYPHVFPIAVSMSDVREIAATKEEIRRAALLSRWSSVVREPVVALTGEDTLTVTVFALDAERGYEIEAAARDRVRFSAEEGERSPWAVTLDALQEVNERDHMGGVPSPSWRRLLLLAALSFVACSNEAGCGGRSSSARVEGPSDDSVGEAPSEPTLPGVARPDAALDARLHAALANKGPSYRPRTHHLNDDGTPRFVNRLILETSPYLLQHAHNPVNWNAWGEEAFERARREGKPVLVSIGYSTCHWCHVMERESFEDEEIARYINEHFVAIKVDREERPDVDDVYMGVVQALTGGGGWPMTVVLTPDKDPIFGGTYFPPRDGERGSRQGFLTILREIATSYDDDRVAVVARAQQLSQRMQAASAPTPPAGVPGSRVIEAAVVGAARSFDPVEGGFGRAPKFPRPAMLDLLLRYHRRTGDAHALEMVVITLERMARGGIHDQVGGGFHRYSTDARWLVPHFEKMLYDNAQLAAVYLSAHQVTGRDDFAAVARDVFSYVAREMTAPGGGFYSATDADSPAPTGHDEEGYSFTWTPAELSAVLGEDDARLAAVYFDVTDRGNFEGRNILHVPRPASVAAIELGITESALASRLRPIREALRVARDARPPPLRDDKIVTSWNGLMIGAFARGALVLDDAELAERAARAARFILDTLCDDDGTLHRYGRDGHTSAPGYLDDYAFFISGLLDLFEATGDGHWLEEALRLQAVLDARFWDEASGGYFTTSRDHEQLITRDKPTYDGAEPAGNSIAILNLLRLHTLTDGAEHRAHAERALGAFAVTLSQSPGASPMMLAALERVLDEPLEVLLVAQSDLASLAPLRARLAATYLPNRALVMTSDTGAARLTAIVPWLEAKRALGSGATAYVCERGRCELPTSDPAVLSRQLRKITPLFPGG